MVKMNVVCGAAYPRVGHVEVVAPAGMTGGWDRALKALGVSAWVGEVSGYDARAGAGHKAAARELAARVEAWLARHPEAAAGRRRAGEAFAPGLPARLLFSGGAPRCRRASAAGRWAELDARLERKAAAERFALVRAYRGSPLPLP